MPKFLLGVIGSVAATCLLAACSGGGNNVTTAPMSMSSSTPANGAVNVSRTAALQMIFSAGLDASTATASNVMLSAASGSSSLTLSTAGTQLTATPAQRLWPLTSYTLTIGTGLAGSNRERLANSQAITFTTADAAWQTAQLIETGNGDASLPQIAFGTNGNAIAVWRQSGGLGTTVWANHFMPGAGWGTAQMIQIDTGEFSSNPQIAIDPNGNAIAVWQQHDGVVFNVYANRFTPSGGWGTPQLIETDNTGNAINPHIVIDSNGNGITVWSQSDGTRDSLWANRFTPGAGWDTAQLIETDNAGSTKHAQIAIDTGGNAIAVWAQSDGTRFNIWANRFASGAGWGTAQLIETDNAGNASSPQIVIDVGGNAIVVWAQSDGTRTNVYANRFASGTGWGTVQLIETDNAGNVFVPQVAIDANGNAIAVWAQSDGTRTNIWANRFTPGTGWGTAQLIETDNGQASTPQIAIDARGNAIATWQQFDGTRTNIWVNRFAPGTGWGTEQLIETDNAGDASEPMIAVDANGNAIAVWYQSDGTRNNIWANRFE